MSPELLAAIGSVIVLALGVNAYFIKSLVESINEVKLATATLLERTMDFDRRITDNSEKIEEIRARRHEDKNEIQKRLLEIELKIVAKAKE